MVQRRKKLWQTPIHMFLECGITFITPLQASKVWQKRKYLKGNNWWPSHRNCWSSRFLRNIWVDTNLGSIWRFSPIKLFLNKMFVKNEWWLVLCFACVWFYFSPLEYYFQILIIITMTFQFWPIFSPIRDELGCLKLWRDSCLFESCGRDV